MILVGETTDEARELSFFLPDRSNPINGVTGYAFTTGQVKIVLPGMAVGSAIDADITRIKERGDGLYALQLTDAQVAGRGKISIIVDVGSDAQPWTNWDDIMSAALGLAPILLGETDPTLAELMFRLPLSSDPLSPLLGYTINNGDLQVRLPGAMAWTAITTANATLVEKGGGLYALQPKIGLLSTFTIGRIYIEANVATAQLYRGDDIIASPAAVAVRVPTLTVISTFPADFEDAHLTQWQGDLRNLTPGTAIEVVVQFDDRNEMYTARDADGRWRWPFDVVDPDHNYLGPTNAEPVRLKLLPRGGWPNCSYEVQVATALIAEVV